MSKSQVIKNLRKRFIVGLIEFILVFPLLFNILTPNQLSLNIIKSIVLFILYFGVFPYVTNGYKPIGLLFGIKIIRISDTSSKSLLSYISRIFFALFSFFSTRGWNKVVINSLGQLPYDEHFQTTVISRQDELSFNQNFELKYYQSNIMNLYLEIGIATIFIIVFGKYLLS